MTFPLLKIVEAQPEPEMNVPKTTEDALARLRLERVGLSERAGQIADVLSKLEAAEDCEREAQAALGELGLAEIAAVKTWVSEGCCGVAPSVDWSKRDILVRMVGEAMANVEASRAVAASFKDEQREVSSRLTALNERLEAAAMDAITEKFANQLAELTKLAEQIQEKQARVFGAVVFVREFADRLMATRTDKATLLFRRLEALAALPQPEFQPSIGATNAKAPVWRELFEGLIK